MLLRIVQRLLENLIKEEQLLLQEGTEVGNLANDIITAMPNAAFASHFGPWLSEQLLNHPGVDELFASDRDITNALKDLGGT